MSIKFLVLRGGGAILGFGGSADFIFMGALIFLIFHVTEMRSSKKIIPKTFLHVIL